jgi:hypothetical protein
MRVWQIQCCIYVSIGLIASKRALRGTKVGFTLRIPFKEFHLKNSI